MKTSLSFFRSLLALTLLSFLLLAAACRSNDASSNTASSNAPVARETPIRNDANTNGNNGNSAKPAEAGDDSSEDFEGTVGITDKQRPGARVAILKEVRTAAHANFDRVVFEFEGQSVPGYRVEYVDKPVRQCGSGNAVKLAGDSWLVVRITPAQAHTESGQASVKDRERHLSLNVLKELELICDFEADVSWALGLASANRYRVLELSGPARLVVDVKH